MEKKDLPNFLTFWNYDDPAGTEAKFREILTIAEESGNMEYYLQLLTQIARAQGLQLKFDDAHATLDQVEKQLTPETKKAKTRYLLERGRAYRSNNQQDKARPFFLEAFEYGRANGLEGLALDAAHMMALIGTQEEKLQWSEKSIALAEASTDEYVRGWLGTLYNNTGWTYHDMGNYDKALEYFQNAYEVYKKGNNTQVIIIAKWMIGRCYRSLERYDEAMQIMFEVNKDWDEAGLPNSGYSYEELGELYLIKGDNEESKKYFRLAYELLSKDEWLQRDEPERLKRMKGLGE